MLCFDNHENIIFHGSTASKEYKKVNMYLEWCGNSENPGPNCVDEEDAYSFRNLKVEMIWYIEKT